MLPTKNGSVEARRAYKERVKKLNGANLIYENEKGEILLGLSGYPSQTDGKYRYMLPGGSIERGEHPCHAACTEMAEETDIHFYEKDLELVATFMQIVIGVAETNGVVFLFRAKKYLGEPKPSEELTEFKYFSHEEIIALAQDEKKDTIGLGYLRMICQYLRWKQSDKKETIVARLSDKVSISQTVDSPLVEV